MAKHVRKSRFGWSVGHPDHTPGEPVHHKPHVMRNVILGVIGVLIVLGAVTGVAGWRLYNQALQVRDHELSVVQSLVSAQGIDQLADGLDETAVDSISQAVVSAQVHASAAKSITDGALWGAAAHMPVIGDDVTAIRGMVNVIDGMIADTLPTLVDTVRTLADSDISGDDGQLNLQPVVDAQSGFARANKLMQSQASILSDLPEPHIGMIKDAYDQGQNQITQVADALRQINGTVQALPTLLGADGPRTYLLVANTTSEQRSGGGLVGSLGTMQVDNGHITVGEFHANTEFVPLGEAGNDEEHAVFDKPLRFSLDMRDEFAIPDFSRTAEMLDDIWQRSQYACDIDGVIAIDPLFIQQMVGINGDITLDNGQVLTGENTAEFMLNGIYKTIADNETQNRYFEYAATAVMDNAFSGMNVPKMIRIAQTLGEMAQNRHFYAYTFHEDEAKYFQGAGFAKNAPESETEPEVGVYMNEQNPSKLGWYLQRSSTVSRTAVNADGSRTYHVTFSITNTLTRKEMEQCTSYILGGMQPGVDGVPVAEAGTSVQRMLFYAPAGGSLSGLTSDGGRVTDSADKTMDGKNLTTVVAYIAPGKTVTFDFDVTTSPRATTDLRLDQTPGGWVDPGVTYEY